MTTVQAEKIARRKLSLLQLAQELGNVSKACRIVGYSRQQFYEIRRSFQLHGALLRSIAHVAYHVGQIVYLGKRFRGEGWECLTIPPGQSAAYNENPMLERTSTRKMRGEDER